MTADVQRLNFIPGPVAEPAADRVAADRVAGVGRLASLTLLLCGHLVGWQAMAAQPGSVPPPVPPTVQIGEDTAESAATGVTNTGVTTLGARSPGARDRAAAHLLALATRDVAADRTDIAQRTLEQLVARYPDSPSTNAARRLLFRIYARSGSADTAPSAVTKPAIGQWRTTVVAVEVFQEEFRNTMGDRVFFSAGSARLGARARPVLMQHAKWLQQRPQLGLVIEGHADDDVASADDAALSRDRAATVRDRLVEEGVEPSRLFIRALGQSRRVADCSTSDCKAQNRRVVVTPTLLSEPPFGRQAGNGADGPD